MILSSGERSRQLPYSTPVRLSLFVTAAPSLLCNIMGLLDKLWDDTVAGPRPENGLGKLRKQPYPSPPHPLLEVPVTPSMAIAKRPQLHNIDTEALSSSPVGSSAPDSPFSRGCLPPRSCSEYQISVLSS